jgi:tyrosyl-tRNA synthetase
MSFPDEVLPIGFELLTEIPLDGVIEKIKEDPMGQKKHLAFEIVKFLWRESAANTAQSAFEKTFQEKAPTFDIKVKAEETLAKTIIPFTPRGSMSSAKELIKQNAIDVNGEVVTDANFKLKVGDEIKVGGRTFLKVSK